MKTKSFNKKLVLNKTTIVNLNGEEMSGLKGGFLTLITCPVTAWEECLSLYFSECPNICNPETFEC